MVTLQRLRHPIFTRRWALTGGLLALSLLFLWPLALHPNAIPMPQTYHTTDLLLTHLPNALYIHDSLLRYHQLPLWNSLLFSGQPFAADPLSGYAYLPNWLTVAFPSPAAFNLLFWLHLAWAGLGMYSFLRANRVRPPAALFAAAAFMGTPKLVAYLASGQVSLVFAVAWTPWLMLCALRMVCRSNRRSMLLFAACMSVTTLADIRWGFFAGLLAGVYILMLFVKQRSRASAPAPAHPVERGERYPSRKAPLSIPHSADRRQVSRILAAPFNEEGPGPGPDEVRPWSVFKSLGLSAALFLLLTGGLTFPLLEFMTLSRRSSLSMDALAIFPVEPSSLIGLFAPQLGLVYELVIYVGLGVLLLALFGLRRSPFWGAVALFAALFSMGQHAFIFPLAARLLPGLSWLRVPSRAWFIVAFALAVLSGYGLDRILAGGFSSKALRRLRLAAFSTSAAAVLLSVGMMLLARAILPGFLMFGLMTPLLWLVVLGLLSGRLEALRGTGLLLFLLLVDLLVANHSYLTYAPLPPKTPAVAWLEEQPGVFRVYSPSYSLPMPNLLEQANGVDPLHLDRYAQYLQAASGMPGGDYSVSLPNMYVDAGTPESVRQASTLPDLDALGRLNVRYLASAYPLESPGLVLRQRFGGTWVYENPQKRERAWLEGGLAGLMSWSPGRLVVDTNGPAGLLQVSETAYPGWQARVDGQPQPIQPSDGLRLAIPLSAGRHRVELTFRPLSVYLGGGIALVSWAAVAVLLLSTWKKGSHR